MKNNENGKWKMGAIKTNQITLHYFFTGDLNFPFLIASMSRLA